MSKIDQYNNQPLEHLNAQITRDVADVLSADISRELNQNPESALSIMRALNSSNGGLPSEFPDVLDIFDPNQLNDYGDRGFRNRNDSNYAYSYQCPMDNYDPRRYDSRENLAEYYDRHDRDLRFVGGDFNLHESFDAFSKDLERNIANILSNSISRDLSINPEHSFPLFDAISGVDDFFSDMPIVSDLFGRGRPGERRNGDVRDGERDKRDGDGDGHGGLWQTIGNVAGDVVSHVTNKGDGPAGGGDDDGEGGGGVWKTIGKVAMNVIPFLL